MSATSTTPADNFTAERRYQRRPNLAATLSIPTVLQHRLEACIAALSAGEAASSLSTEISTLLSKLLHAETAEAQLRVISQMIGKISEAEEVEPSLLTNLGRDFVFPWLLDCRVRYAHKALIGFAKTYLAQTGAANALEASFAEAHLQHVWPSRHLPKDTVLHFVNSLDAITVTAAPVFHGAFAAQFFPTLPFLAQSLHWSLDNAFENRKQSTMHHRAIRNAIAVPDCQVAEDGTARLEEHPHHQHQEGAQDEGSVFGEDLDLIRFCVRVVATHVHKFLYTVVVGIDGGSEFGAWTVAAQHGLVGVLHAAMRMLSSPLLPKDVLNAAGLLIASIVTLRGPRREVLAALCGSPAPTLTGVTTGEGAGLEVCTALVRSLCDHDDDVVVGATTLKGLLHQVAASFTHHGRFATFKGLLSHVSSALPSRRMTPVSQPSSSSLPSSTDAPSVGFVADALLRCGHEDRRSVVHHEMVEIAEKYTAEVEEPDTRFMAIQTLDAVARHIAAVLDAGAVHAQQWAAALPLRSFELPPLSPLRTEVIAGLVQVLELLDVTPPLRRTIDTIVRVVMRLWDDPTQQVSGPLYDTYSVVFSINGALSRLHAACVALRQVAPQHLPELAPLLEAHVLTFPPQLLSPRDALLSVLGTQNDRRGKYHALLAVVGTPNMSREGFLEALCQHYAAHRDAPEEALCTFTSMLIAGSCNSKICSVCGEVLAAVAKKVIAGATPAEEMAFVKGEAPNAVMHLWRHAFIEPVVTSASGGAAHFRGLNISATQATSCVLAHMLAPLLKRWPSRTLGDALAALQRRLEAANRDAAAAVNHTAMVQSTVETLSRARGSNVDISGFVSPSNPVVVDMVCQALQSYEFEIRHTAFGLVTVSLKGSEPVTAWQCRVVERYVVFHVNQGGDSTARNAFLQGFRKWMGRLVDSVTSSKTRTGVAAAEGSSSKRQKREPRTSADEAHQLARYDAYVHLVFEHVGRLAAIAQSHGCASPDCGSSGSTEVASSLQGLSLERRFTALSLWKSIADAWIPLIFVSSHAPATPATPATGSAHAVVEALKRRGTSPSRVSDVLLPASSSAASSSIVASLLLTLSEGWDKIRDVAVSLLDRYATLHPESLRSQPALQVLPTELMSPKFRLTEGAVARKRIQLSLDASTTVSSELVAAIQVVSQRCREMQSMRSIGEIYDAMKSSPLHGLVSWVGCLHDLALRGAPHTADTADSNDVLGMCREVLLVCTSLVSGGIGSGADDEATGQSSSTTKIDCRGHVYQQEQPHQHDSSLTSASHDAESVSRIVVNNSWLGIRAAATVVESVMGACCKMPQQQPSVSSSAPLRLRASCIYAVANALVETLLKTKHNGVMSKSRQSLRVISSALLRTKHVEYYELPSRILAGLLGPEGVTSDSEARVLRRSQGLPHAILPLLESEDPTVPFSLFPSAMDVLLTVANERHCTAEAAGSSLVIAHRVNALNVLKFIFDNRTFSTRVVPYLQPAFLIATAGFQHANWTVRNSSLMLFSSVLHRFVGDHPSIGGAGVNNSFHDLALRIPRGIRFVLEELEAAVGYMEQAAQLQPRNAADTKTMQESVLFPALLMLSMLTPDAPHLTTNVSGAVTTHADTNSNGAIDDGRRATGLVLRCRCLRDLMVRGASAKALCGLVPVSNVRDVVRSLGAVLSDDGTLPLNGVHGAALHLRQFFAHYVGTVSFEERDAVAATRVSSHYLPTLATSVLYDVTSALCRCRERLVEASVSIPTIATVFFSLITDIVFYHGVFRKCKYDDETIECDRDPLHNAMLESLMACGITCGARMVAAWRETSLSQADSTASRRALGAMIAVLAQHAATVCTSVMDAATLEELRGILVEDALQSCTVLLRNMRSVTYWIAATIATRTGEAVIDAFPHRSKTCVFSPQRSAATRNWLDERMYAASLPPIAGQLQSLLQELLRHTHTDHHSIDRGFASWSIARHEKLSGALRYLLAFNVECLGLLKPQLITILERVPYTEAKCFAVQALAHAISQHVPAISADADDAAAGSDESVLLRHVVACSDASMPVACRLGAVAAILTRFRADARPGHHHNGLLVVFLRLLFDDDEQVRHAACQASTVLATATTSCITDPRHCFCHTTSVLTVARRLLANTRREASTAVAEQLKLYVLGESNDADDGEGDDDDDMSDADDDGDDTLFAAEADNMFAEKRILATWVGFITCESTSVETPVGLNDVLRQSIKGNAAEGYLTTVEEGLAEQKADDGD